VLGAASHDCDLGGLAVPKIGEGAVDDSNCLRPQRDSSWPTDTHQNIRRGAALRDLVSDVGWFGCSAGCSREPRFTEAFPGGVANGWQKTGARGSPIERRGASASAHA